MLKNFKTKQKQNKTKQKQNKNFIIFRIFSLKLGFLLGLVITYG